MRTKPKNSMERVGFEKGLEDIKNGNVYKAENSEDLVKQILGK